MPIYTDQLKQQINLPDIPRRIVSLVPSQTELLFDLGLDSEVIGITKFCVHPDHWFHTKTRIGGTKTDNIPLIQSLQPDLIIANKEENIKEQVAALQDIAPVWVSDICNIKDALHMIEDIGTITGKSSEAELLTIGIKKQMAEVSALGRMPGNKQFKTAYLIWKDPYMAAGSETFINDILQLCGWENVLADQARYPAISIEQLRSSGTELVFLSSEPYPFRQKHINQLQQDLPGVKLVLADGEMFSWYGSRLTYATEYLKKMIVSLNSE